MTATAPVEGLTRLAGRVRERVERQIELDPLIGKDILELLSSSMYVDPRAIYREYVQNSADAIDEAYASGLLEGERAGRIDIAIDSANRSISIRDNGVGVAAKDAERVLTSFGASRKRGSVARGFRGVGRLAAFGYAQSVSFKTKAAGETHSTEVRWDCRKLKAALTNPSYQGDLRQVVRDVVTFASQLEPKKEEHYFEVRLEKVVRIKNDMLLDPVELEQYLGQVAPAPFKGDFYAANRIETLLGDQVPPCNFLIFINGGKRHITRPYRSEFDAAKGKTDTIRDVEHHLLVDEDGSPQAIVWVAHHSYLGALHSAPDVRGLRARVGDMQVGDEQIFMSHFPEPRFNSWTVGEVHVLDRRIIPNGRRDGFEQSERFIDLVTRLTPILRGIGAKCRSTSAARERVRRFDAGFARVRELFAVLKSRDLTPRRETLARNEIGRVFAEMAKVLGYVGLVKEERQKLKRRLTGLQSEYDNLKTQAGGARPFMGLPPARRQAYEEAIDILYELVPANASGAALVDRLIQRLEKKNPKRSSRKQPKKSSRKLMTRKALTRPRRSA